MLVDVKVDLKVRCIRVSGGFSEHADRLKQLKLGQIYTVVKVKIMDAYTFVWLKELPGVAFNSIHFKPLEYKHLYDGVFADNNEKLEEFKILMARGLL